MRLGGAWVDVSTDVRVEDGIEINHGLASEGGTADPSQCRLTLANPSGKYSPRNPSSVYYGQIGRNTPIRVAEARSLSWLEVVQDGASLGYASCPDTAALSITGDIDIRMEVASAPVGVVTKSSADQMTLQSYRMYRDEYGRLKIQWSTTGTSWTHFLRTTRPVPYRAGTIAYRATLDVDNGAGGHTASFYWSATIGGTWTLLETVTGSGTTSIADTSGLLYVGCSQPTSTLSSAVTDEGTRVARVNKVAVLQGIAGTVRAAPDFTALSEGATSFSDGTQTWTITNPARVTKLEARFSGAISEFPSRWDPSGADVKVPVVASGVSRRLVQGSQALSSLRGAITNDPVISTQLTAYWPMEEGIGSTSFGSAVNGGTPMTFAGSPIPGNYSPKFLGSRDLPTFENAGAMGTVTTPAGTNASIAFVLALPEDGTTNLAEILRFVCGGTANLWTISYETAGTNLRIQAWSVTSTAYTLILSTTFSVASLLGREAFFSLELLNSGANVNWAFTGIDIGFSSGTIVTQSVSAIRNVQIGSGTVPLAGDVSVGHVATGSDNLTFFSAALVRAFDKNESETFDQRLYRCGQFIGAGYHSTGGDVGMGQMGREPDGTYFEQMQDVQAASVSGVLMDHVESYGGLTWVDRTAFYSSLNAMFPPLALTYTSKHLTPPLLPTDDDRYTVNDAVANNPTGGEARYQRTTGPLNLNPYPAGVGRYSVSRTTNVYLDASLMHSAGWIVNLGTTDATRFPTVTIDLVRNSALDAAVSALRVGSWITLKSLPAWLPPGDVELVVLGWSELIGSHTRLVTLNCAPAAPHKVFQIASQTYGRLTSTTTVTNEALDTTETGVDYTGDTWITTATRPGDFPFDIVIGGEVMRVTSATASTFTVTRSVNGVVKSHLTGAPIDLAYPVHWAI